MRRLSVLSGYSSAKLQGIKNYWLVRMPKEKWDYAAVQYMVYDATYFHKEGCLLNLMDATSKRIIAHLYVHKESFGEAYPWFLDLRYQGLSPAFITTDGERSILRAMNLVWPQASKQRCLYHLQHEGMRWLRTYPKTEAGKVLRSMLSNLCSIRTAREKEGFIDSYRNWANKYRDSVIIASGSTIASKDLKRTMVLINNALPDMFYYLEDKRVQPTTNALEGFHSRLKESYRRHRGLCKVHRTQFISWYCYFENHSL